MTDLLTTVQMAGGLIDECVRQYCAELEQLNYDRATISLYRQSIMRLRERMIEHGVALDALTPDIATELVLRADSHGDRRPLCCLRRQALRRLSRNGIVTETGSEASGVPDRMSAWARSATAAIASRPRSSSTRSGSISASP